MHGKPTVDVSIKSENGGATTLVIDGKDVSTLVLAKGFAVDFGLDDNKLAEPTITVVLPVGKLTIDLPDAVLRAIAQGEVA